MKKKMLLPHQGAFIQAPLLFPEKRFHLLVAGYGAGKTSTLASMWAYYCNLLQGKKSMEGHNPRILLGGVTLGHLEKTTLAYIKQDLEHSNTKYYYDKKLNRLTVGNVDTILVSLSAPHDIVGFDCAISLADEIDDLNGSDETTFEAVRSVNERTRQVLKDFRKPFLAFCSTAQGQKGLYRVVTNFRKSGVGFVLLRGRTVDNKYLDAEYVESLTQVYTERERRVYLEGYFEALASGRVLGDFDWDKNFVKIDMDKEISDTDLVYWSQDFNCQPGFTKIATDKGFKTMENLSVGDMILTRKGYRKCLTKVKKGASVIVKTGGTWSTLGHPFITKDGVVDACDAKSYFYLKKRVLLKQKLGQTANARIKLLESCLMGLSIEDTRNTTTSSTTKQNDICTLIYTPTTMGQYLKVMLFTIKTGLWITGLRVLNALRGLNILRCITLGRGSRSTGKTGASMLQVWFAGFVAKHLQVKLKRLVSAQKSASKNTLSSESVGLKGLSRSKSAVKRFGRLVERTATQGINLWTKFVCSAALAAKDRVTPVSAWRVLKPVKTLQNGRILYGCEKPVWDIEVAGEHEYFADGVLVHNSGYHRGCCAILRGNIIYVVKDYEFPDIREAPRVVRNDFPRNKIIWIPDATAKDMIKTFTRELYKHGIFWVMRGKNPNVEDSAFIANKLLWTKRLIFTSAAQDTASDCALAQRDQKTNQIPKGQGRNSPIHRVDTVRMLCFFLTVTQKSLLDIRKATIQRHLDYQEDEPAVTELSDGYAMINPSAL